MTAEINLFPHKTLDYMIKKSVKNKIINDRLKDIKSMTDLSEKNYFFGYTQRIGEIEGLWTLDEIIKSVREEFKKSELVTNKELPR